MKGGAVFSDSPVTVIMSENELCFCSAEPLQTGCDKKQTFRFLGCKDTDVNCELENLYCESVRLVLEKASLKAVWRKSSLSFCGEDEVIFDFGEIKSTSLVKNLKGCKSVYIFAATAGIGIDRLMLRYKELDAVKAMMISAVGSSVVECWCDKVNEDIVKGKKSRPRFSPGYGGVDLRHQKEILSFLDAEKRLGITLTDSFFMTPVKSVTAFIGVED